jgi:hypothetical protein
MNVSGVFSNVLPEFGTTVFVTPGTDRILQMATSCQRPGTGRQVRIGGVDQVDISLCNLVDNGLDIVYVPSENIIYLHTRVISTSVLSFIAILVRVWRGVKPKKLTIYLTIHLTIHLTIYLTTPSTSGIPSTNRGIKPILT